MNLPLTLAALKPGSWIAATLLAAWASAGVARAGDTPPRHSSSSSLSSLSLSSSLFPRSVSTFGRVNVLLDLAEACPGTRSTLRGPMAVLPGESLAFPVLCNGQTTVQCLDLTTLVLSSYAGQAPETAPDLDAGGEGKALPPESPVRGIPSLISELHALDDSSLLVVGEREGIFRIDRETGLVSPFAPQGAGGSGAPAPLPPDLRLEGKLLALPDGSFLLSTDHQVLRLDAHGVLSPFAGTGHAGAHVGSTALATDLMNPKGLLLLQDGSVVIADFNNQRLLRITAESVTVIADAARVRAALHGARGRCVRPFLPVELVALPDGAVVVMDRGNNQALRIDPHGTISVFAGIGVPTPGHPADSFDPHDPTRTDLPRYSSMVALADGTVLMARGTGTRILAFSPMDELQVRLEALVERGVRAARAGHPDALQEVRQELASMIGFQAPELDFALATVPSVLVDMVRGYLASPPRDARVRLASRSLEAQIAHLLPPPPGPGAASSSSSSSLPPVPPAPSRAESKEDELDAAPRGPRKRERRESEDPAPGAKKPTQ